MLKAAYSVKEHSGLDAAGAGLEEDEAAAQHEEENKQVLAKVTRNVVPLLWLIMFFSLLSRINLTSMHVVLTEDLHLSEYQYGGALGAFYLAYVVFPVPSNLILERMRMNLWMALLVCSWGVITMLSIFVSGAYSLIAVRFCLGLAEAGLSPGIYYYVTRWFSEKYRIRQIALIHTSIGAGNACSGVISGLILDHLDGILGFKGWQWLCLITGAPPVLLSLVFYFFLPNSPGDARFLTPREREVIISARSLAASTWTTAQKTSKSLLWSTLSSATNWVLFFCGMFLFATIAGISGFTPALLYEAGSPLYVSNLLVVVPSCFSIVTLIVWSFHAERMKERFWHIFIALFVSLFALGGCIAFVYFGSLVLVVVLLSVYQSALFAGYSVFMAELFSSLSGSLAIGIAMYYAVIGFGGWFGPFMMGYTRDYTGDHVVGLAFMCTSLAFAIALLSIFHVTQRSTQAEIGAPMRIQVDSDSQATEGARYAGEDSMGGAAILV